MIISMSRVRVLGPKRMLRPTVAALQDLGLLHVTEVTRDRGLRAHQPTPREQSREHRVRRALEHIEATLEDLERLGEVPVPDRSAATGREGEVVRAAIRLRARLAAVDARCHALREERDALAVYQPLFDEFDALLSVEGAPHRFSAYLLLIHETSPARLQQLEELLAGIVGRGYDLHTRRVRTGETVLLLLVPRGSEAALERELGTARVDSAPIPAAFRGMGMIDALPRMRPRLAAVRRELVDERDQVRALASSHGPALVWARHRFRDELAELEAERSAAETARAFVLEGWVPERRFADLTDGLESTVGGIVSVRALGRDEWRGAEAPVVLSNPRLFAPFERITALLPLPRYGTFDPTPFVAVFFPMLFGIVVGDVGYGAVMGLIALLLRGRAPRRGLRRDLARIGGAMALFTIVFGVLYGELFGDLGRRVAGMPSLWLHREEAVVPFLILALALGVGHLAIGLALSALSQRRSHPRAAIGRGLSLLMLGLIVVALLAVFERLPSSLFTPTIIALLIAFPILIAVEGLGGMFEFLTIFGHVLSYARVMAVGTASVMLAVVANRMAGAFGSAAIGIVFALLFHLVNFGIALFSPTIHVLRLHYVEFFSTFYSPGGVQYRPLAHWTPTESGS